MVQTSILDTVTVDLDELTNTRHLLLEVIDKDYGFKLREKYKADHEIITIKIHKFIEEDVTENIFGAVNETTSSF
jgi:hypothetical protein